MFRAIVSVRDVADLLELDWSQLYYITSRAADRYSYRTFAIPKKGGGERVIQTPHPTVRILQHKLLEVLSLVYQPHPAAHGFVHERSIKTNATPHVNRRWVLNYDLQDFFPSITFPRVRGIFIKRFRLPPGPATVLARLCCNTGDTPDHLPQGAPTSPIISNMICHSLDHQFVQLAKRNGVFYTRYADDLTFSTNRTAFPLGIAETSGAQLIGVGNDVKEIIKHNHFDLNHRKARISGRASRQDVTGLTVNKRINVRRRLPREIRSMLHKWKAHGYEAAEVEFHTKFDVYGRGANYRNVVSGKLAFLRNVRGIDDRVFRRLYGWAKELDNDSFSELPPLATNAPSLAEAVRDFPTITASDNKQTRRGYLKRMFASARGTLWVVDPNLKADLLTDLVASIEPGRVSDIRLLSRDERLSSRQKVKYTTSRQSLLAKGVNLEWRVLPPPQRYFHDRWLADDSDCVSIGGPFSSIYDPRPPLGQNLLARRPEQFDTWWNRATPLTTG
ncbi:MAG: RNA-directed DNA polymerase [Chloroflexi bacterium]|nr:RNA-directed DNA polymerase [Chloroflexota bacterium]